MGNKPRIISKYPGLLQFLARILTRGFTAFLDKTGYFTEISNKPGYGPE